MEKTLLTTESGSELFDEVDAGVDKDSLGDEDEEEEEEEEDEEEVQSKVVFYWNILKILACVSSKITFTFGKRR